MMTKYFLVASLSAVVGLSASANSNYPDVKRSSANTNSATSGRLQDPTNPAGAYDTDKSGYANRWNAEDRITAQPLDETHWHARGVNAGQPLVTSSASRTTVSTTRSSAEVDHRADDVDHSVNRSFEKDTDKYSGYNGDRPERLQQPRTYTETDRSEVNTASAPMSAEEASDTSYRADNSGLNKRDRSESAETADKQAGMGVKSDVELTRKIRRELTKDDSLSTYGKNVKIMTKGGETTLRGPVISSEEKDKVEDAAERIVGTNKVRNELEIKH